MKFIQVAIVMALALGALGDVFLHNPRGSNNKLSDDNQGIPNSQRLFHSANDREGGYNAPPETSQQMYFYTGSELSLEWTISAGCGSNRPVDNVDNQPGGGQNSHECDIVLQYMCSDEMRNGVSQNTIQDNMETYNQREDGGAFTYGMHENYAYFQGCKRRTRNKALFTGGMPFDNQQATARFTRQNPGGSRFGFECQEERDYYPYWLPTPWRDIAIITSRPERCPELIAESQNTKSKGYCEADQFDSEESCPAGQWKLAPSWRSELNSGGAPECIDAPYAQENILSGTLNGEMMRYNWTLPNDPATACVLRIRYNVTAGGFEDRTSSTSPPIAIEPVVKCCNDAGSSEGKRCDCQLYHSPYYAPNRVYQDRSHIFEIRARPDTVLNKIHNLNVRGKRGNIVQTFPAMEYDFTPNVLECRAGEWVHMQWTGSDNNPAGNDGEGQTQTDRNNVIQLRSEKWNYPIDEASQTFLLGTAAPRLATNDLYIKEMVLCDPIDEFIDDDDDGEDEQRNCAKLNAAVPYYDGGLQSCHSKGVYHFFNSRNNNFSNRAQKGHLVVRSCDGAATCRNGDQLPLDQHRVLYDSSASSLTASALLLLIACALFF